jgi:Meckel syndrome type 1 protein
VARTPARHARALALDALSLAAVVLLSFALLAVWRGRALPVGGGVLGGGVLRAARFLPVGADRPEPLRTAAISNGLFERARGAPLLFVRGRVQSSLAAPVPGVRIAVELVRGGSVLARAEALAGAVPSPEELWGVADAADLARVAAAAARRAPKAIRAGDDVPFLVALTDYPADLDGATVRLSATALPAAGAPR